MPILALDKFGRIYETSPDREDGLGIKSYPEMADQQDCTLGSAYLKSEERRRNQIINERRAHKMIEAQDKAYYQMMRQRARQAKMKELAEQKMLAENEIIKNNQLRKALAMGCPCEEGYKVGITGNALSANGLMGKDGWSRDQRAIHNAVSPERFDKNTAYMVDPVEAEQQRHREAAYKILRQKSQKAR